MSKFFCTSFTTFLCEGGYETAPKEKAYETGDFFLDSDTGKIIWILYQPKSNKYIWC